MKAEISFKKLRTVDGELSDCMKRLRQSITEAEDISANLKSLEDSGLYEIAKKLMKRSEDIRYISESMGFMYNTLNDILAIYDDCEETVLDILEGGQLKKKLKIYSKENSLKHFTVLLKKMNLHFNI